MTSVRTQALTRLRRRGSALIGALGFLAVLAAFALTFCAVMRTEGRASSNALAGARARALAEAGIHRAIAELGRSELPNPLGTGGAWRIPDPGTPIERADAGLSYATGDGTSSWSGSLGGTLAPQGDRYLIRVFDTSAKLDLNADPDSLAGMLDVLGRAIALAGARAGKAAYDPVRGRGAAIAALVRDHRPRSVRELDSCLGPGDARALQDFVTADAVRDPTTIRWTGALDDRGYPVATAAPRAPVCANTASWPVLVSVFAGVTGADGVPVGFEQAAALADALVAWRSSSDVVRGPIATWESFGRFVDGAAFGARLTPAQKDAVLANASPNLAVAQLNPDAVGLRLGTTSALLRGTTELSLFTSGVYEIEVLGRIHDRDGSVVAEARQRAVARIFEVARHTTQADFEAGTGAGVTMMPAPPTDPPSRIAGWVQLARSPASIPDGAAVVDYASGSVTPVLAAASSLGAAPAGPHHLPGSLVAFSSCDGGWRWPAGSSAPLGPLDIATGPTGVLRSDGLSVGPRSVVQRYALQAGGTAGTRAFWLKLGSDELKGTICEEDVALDADYGIHSSLAAGRGGGALVLDYDRKLVAFGQPRNPPPGRVARSRTQVVLNRLGAPYEWHQLQVAWKDPLAPVVAVDGVPMPADLTPIGVAPLPSQPGARNLLAVGGDLSGTPSACTATLDALAIAASPAPSTAAPDRYGLPGQSAGHYENTIVCSDVPVALGAFAWTAVRPRQWGGIQFNEDEFQLVATLSFGAGPRTITGSGAPTPAYADDTQAALDQAQQAHLAHALRIQADIVQLQQQLQTSVWSPGSTSPQEVARLQHQLAVREAQLAHVQAQLGIQGNGKGAGSRKGVASSSGSTTSGGVVSVGGGSAPDVVLCGACVHYAFDFVYDRASVAARGQTPPPLDVSPVLEDVTLTYTTGARILRVESLDE